MKYLLCALLLISGSAFSQNCVSFIQGLSWKEILAQAQKEKKMIFFDIHSSSCMNCQPLCQDCFCDTKVSQLLNIKFVNVKLSADSLPILEQIPFLKNDSAGKKEIKKIPVFVFTDSKGNVVSKKEEKTSPAEFIIIANKALSTENKGKSQKAQ